MLRKTQFCVVLLLLAASPLLSQNLSKKQEKELAEKAEYYYGEGYYMTALNAFEKLSKNKPKDPYYKLMTGICYSYDKKNRSKAIDYLLEVRKMNPDFVEAQYYMGRAYMVNHKFTEAIKEFTAYRGTEGLPEEDIDKAHHMIEYCQSAQNLIKDSVEVKITNIGSPINTDNEEYVPLIAPDESILIYTYRGKRSLGGKMDKTGKPDPDGDYYEDIFISVNKDDKWSEPASIGDNINTSGHDASIALSTDGQNLYIFKSTKKDLGDIYVSRLEGSEWSKPQKIQGDVNSDKSWEGSASVTSDGQKLFFASDREGGFGGRDLYVAELQEDGTWGNVQNLGPTINTKYNEDAPFIHPDMITMYFSSEGHHSMGGYDIFYSQLDKGNWTTPSNVGYPVNTIDDDRYYVLSADGETGYYSTSGKSSVGGHDIFTVTPGSFAKKPILALVVGVVTADNEPVDADIKVTNMNTGQEAGNFKSNSNTGKYMLALTPGNKYKIAIEVDGYLPAVEYLDIESLETYVQVAHDIKLVSDSNKVAVNTEPTLQDKLKTQIDKYKSESPCTYGSEAYKELLKRKGNMKLDGYQYFVDLGFDFPGNDGKGPFATLKEANDFRNGMIEKDPKNTGLRIMMKDGSGKTEATKYWCDDMKKIQYTLTDVHSTMTGDSVPIDTTSGITELPTDQLANKDSLQDAGSEKIKGLSFKVEIASVKDTNDFKLGYLEKYGKITRKLYPDGTYRYTFGPFETLEQAEQFRIAMIEKEKAAEDAFITVFVFGERKTLPEYKAEPKDSIPPAVKDTTPPVKPGPCDRDTFISFAELVGKDLNDIKWYNLLLQKGGNLCAEGLVFEVQIAAYRFPDNYKYGHLMQFGQPVIRPYPDGITRFTQGSFTTLNDAEALRQKIIAAGQKDAWVTPFFEGKRMLMEELIAVNFYGRSIN